MEKEGLNATGVSNLLNKKSGVLGVSGVNNKRGGALWATPLQMENCNITITTTSY